MLGAARRLRGARPQTLVHAGTARTLGISVHELARRAAKAGLTHEIAWVKQLAPEGARDCWKILTAGLKHTYSGSLPLRSFNPKLLMRRPWQSPDQPQASGATSTVNLTTSLVRLRDAYPTLNT